MNTLLRSKYASVVLPTVTTLLLFILWEIIVKIFHIPSFNVPAPSAIWSAAVEKSQPLIENSLVTVQTTMVGFSFAIVAGIFLGFLIDRGFVLVNSLYGHEKKPVIRSKEGASQGTHCDCGQPPLLSDRAFPPHQETGPLGNRLVQLHS